MCLLSKKINDDYVKQHLLMLPEWFSIAPTQEKYAQNDFIIGSVPFVLKKEKAKKYLTELEKLFHTTVDFKIFEDFFKIINYAIAHPLTKDIFDLKVKSLYSLFKKIPLILFNIQTCKQLAVLSPFFPSAHDVERIMIGHHEEITRNINLLEKLTQSN